MITILIILLILVLVGVIPNYEYSRSWGYWPSSFVGVILLILLLTILF